MRWFVLISVLAVYLMAPAFAAEVTLYGPQQFRRERHEPVTAKETFPGVPGTANLTVEFDTNSKCRPESAVIWVNGTIVLRPHDFNHVMRRMDRCERCSKDKARERSGDREKGKGERKDKDDDKERDGDGVCCHGLIERTITVAAQNSLWVEIRGEPGARVVVHVVENIAANAGAVIGASGGTISITDPASSLNGFELEIPGGALAVPTVIRASVVANPYSVQPTVRLEPSGLHFLVPAVLTLPYSPEGGSEDFFEDTLSLSQAEDVDGDWQHDDPVTLDRVLNLATFSIAHFSIALVSGDRFFDEQEGMNRMKNPGGRPVLLVHGIAPKIWVQLLSPWIRPAFGDGKGDHTATFGALAALLNAQGFRVYAVDYQTKLSFQRCAASLRAAIKEVRERTAEPRVALVCHSMGGMVARTYLQGRGGMYVRGDRYVQPAVYQDDVDELITLGTPHNGSGNSLLLPLRGGLANWQSAWDLLPTSEICTILNDKTLVGVDLPRHVQYTVIYGNLERMRWVPPNSWVPTGEYTSTDERVTTDEAQLTRLLTVGSNMPWSGYDLNHIPLPNIKHTGERDAFGYWPMAYFSDADYAAHPVWPYLLDALREGGTPDAHVKVLKFDFDPGVRAGESWSQDGLTLTVEGSFEFDVDGASGVGGPSLWLFPGSLCVDLRPVMGTVERIEVDVVDWGGRIHAYLLDADLGWPVYASRSGEVETLTLPSVPGAEYLCVNSNEGQVLEVRVFLSGSP